MKRLNIFNVTIRTDLEGRYCLNDLHKASGGENKLRPSLWLENKQTIELIGECSIAGIPAIQSKQQLGTFVTKELVYAYAMWISPAFHLKVIRAYDTMQLDSMRFFNDPQAMRGALLIYTEKVIDLEAKIDEDAPKVRGFDRIAEADGNMNITAGAKVLQLKRKDLIHMLDCDKWVYRRGGGGSLLGYQSKVQQGLLTHKVRVGNDGKSHMQVMLTPKGLTKLAEMIGMEDICAFKSIGKTYETGVWKW